MAQASLAERGTDLYERLLQRLALALEEAETARFLRAEDPHELELSGLTAAELELIQAYLDHDLHWLRGWHAAAEQMATLQRQPKLSVRLAGAGMRSRLGGCRQQLHCALCGTPAHWQRNLGVMACACCGSKLFRSGKPR